MSEHTPPQHTPDTTDRLLYRLGANIPGYNLDTVTTGDFLTRLGAVGFDLND